MREEMRWAETKCKRKRDSSFRNTPIVCWKGISYPLIKKKLICQRKNPEIMCLAVQYDKYILYINIGGSCDSAARVFSS